MMDTYWVTLKKIGNRIHKNHSSPFHLADDMYCPCLMYMCIDCSTCCVNH